jgi:hypothetical protein
MRHTSACRPADLFTAAVLVLALAAPALAGPPLICHELDAGTATLLPWASDGRNWNSPDPSYDISRVTADTLRLLSPELPVLARMETMRRATIYASRDPRIAAELLRAVTDRARDDAGKGDQPMAWFDAGYLIESYRQMSPILAHDARPVVSVSGLDGYGMVLKAIRLAGTPEMEYAASLMKTGAVADAHRRRARAGAAPGSLLAKNLAQF